MIPQSEPKASVARDIENPIPLVVYVESQPEVEPDCESDIHWFFAWNLFGISVLVSSFDLFFSATDHSCSHGPDKSVYLIIEDYLKLHGGMSIGLCVFWAVKQYAMRYYKHGESNEWICLWIIGNLMDVLCKAFLCIWNLFGIMIYWSDIYRNANCSQSLSMYVAFTVHFKIIMVSVFYYQEKRHMIEIEENPIA